MIMCSRHGNNMILPHPVTWCARGCYFQSLNSSKSGRAPIPGSVDQSALTVTILSLLKYVSAYCKRENSEFAFILFVYIHTNVLNFTNFAKPLAPQLCVPR